MPPCAVRKTGDNMRIARQDSEGAWVFSQPLTSQQSLRSSLPLTSKDIFAYSSPAPPQPAHLKESNSKPYAPPLSIPMGLSMSSGPSTSTPTSPTSSNAHHSHQYTNPQRPNNGTNHHQSRSSSPPAWTRPPSGSATLSRPPSSYFIPTSHARPASASSTGSSSNSKGKSRSREGLRDEHEEYLKRRHEEYLKIQLAPKSEGIGASPVSPSQKREKEKEEDRSGRGLGWGRGKGRRKVGGDSSIGRGENVGGSDSGLETMISPFPLYARA